MHSGCSIPSLFTLQNTTLEGDNGASDARTCNLSTSTTSQTKEVKTPLLPIDGMPPFIQEYIKTCSSVYNTPRDYWAGSAIMATALAIGDKIELHTKYKNVPILWMNIIGNVSSGKTEAIDQPLKPFEKIDSKAIEAFKIEYQKYDSIEKMTTKERKDEGLNKIPEPKCFQYIVKDSTPEALNQVHSINTRGLMISRDELKGWIDDFGRYAHGGEQSNMISSWTRVGWVTNRKGGGVNSIINIPKPFISVFGGMQPDLIPTLAADNRAENGFLSRICNVWPDHADKPKYNENTVSQDLVERWDDYIVGLTRIPKQDIITLSVEAKKLYEDWFNKNGENSKAESSGYLQGVYGKLDIISLRMAVVIYGMDLTKGTVNGKQVTGEEMKAALDITDYFRVTALKVHHKLFKDHPKGADTKEVIKYLCAKGHSQTKIAELVKVSQPYVNKTLREVIQQNHILD